MIRFGVIGCGAIYTVHCTALQTITGAKLVTVYDEVHSTALEAANKFGVSASSSLDELLDQVDAVIVCTPSGLHAEIGIRAAQAGKHVIVEKPMDTTMAKARALVQACRESNVKFTTISQHRFSTAIRRLRSAVRDGDLGSMVMGDAYIKWYRTQAYYDSGGWRGTWALDGGGCLMNQGVHYIDMIQWIMGGVKSVQAQVRTLAHDIEVEDVATAIVQYKSGAMGVIQGSTSCYPGMAERIEVHGRNGSIVVEGDRIKMWKVDAAAAQTGKYGGGVMMQPTPSLHLSEQVTDEIDDATAKWGEQHRLQIEDFVRAIQDDRDPFIQGEESLEPLKVILAIYESSRLDGAKVELS